MTRTPVVIGSIKSGRLMVLRAITCVRCGKRVYVDPSSTLRLCPEHAGRGEK